MKKTIYIAIEIKVREFLSNILLSFFAAKKNYRIIFGSKNQIINYLTKKKTKGGIFLYKAGIHKKYISTLNKKIDLHATIDQEIGPGLSDKFYSKLIPQSFHRETAKDIDLYFCLNAQLFKIAKKTLGNKVGKIVNTGWPRFEIFKSQHSKLFSDKVKQIKKKYDNFYLFNSDFFFISKYYKEQVLHYAPWSIEENKQKRELNKRLVLEEASRRFKEFSNVQNFLKDVSEKFKIKIVIRPHPGESIKVWKKIFKNYKNIFIEPPLDDVHPWIMACKGLLHRGCTTSYQSALINKPTAYLTIGTKKEIKDFHLNDWHFKKAVFDFSTKINNSKDLINWIKNTNKTSKKNLKKIYKDTGYDKNSPSALILKCFKNTKIKINKEPTPTKMYEDSSKIKFYYYFLRHLFLSKLFIYFTKLGLLSKNIEKYDMAPKIFEGIKAKEVNFFLQILNKNSKSPKKNVKAYQLNQDLVVIE
tara:strand:+ start:83 stop:1498 length:1416 start_codon:yes stop_codon:yes gene_type:complete